MYAEGTYNSEIHLPPTSTVDSSVPVPRGLRSTNVSPSDTSPKASFREPKEGLFCRTRRVLGLKHGHFVEKSNRTSLESSMASGLGGDLHRVSSQLRNFKSKERDKIRSDTSTSSLSIAAPSAITRWHHFRSNHTGTGHSNSGSFASFNRGFQEPVTTPDSRSMYNGSDMGQHLKIEMTDPEAPNFLPSEARRVDISDKRDLRRYMHPNAQETFENPLSMNFTNASSDPLDSEIGIDNAVLYTQKEEKDLQHYLGLPTDMPHPEWYMVKFGKVDPEEVQTREQFVLSVPEHLPSSPMCPRHPKNKSKGKGVCVYHGRNVL